MASSQVALPASYGTHTPGSRASQTVRLLRLLTPSRFSMSVGQARRGPLASCSLTMRSGSRYIHHNHIPRLVPVGSALLAKAVLSQQRTRLFYVSASQFSSCLLLDWPSFAILLVEQIIRRVRTIFVSIASCVRRYRH